MTMKDLIAKSFRLRTTEKVSRLNDTYTMTVPHRNGKFYCYNNGIILYIKNGASYVVPYSKEAMATLEENGYKERPMYVPFSNYDEPVDRYEEYCRKFNKAV